VHGVGRPHDASDRGWFKNLAQAADPVSPPPIRSAGGLAFLMPNPVERLPSQALTVTPTNEAMVPPITLRNSSWGSPSSSST
jgi:hypothetical protein